jgi:hypothetical protein
MAADHSVEEVVVALAEVAVHLAAAAVAALAEVAAVAAEGNLVNKNIKKALLPW